MPNPRRAKLNLSGLDRRADTAYTTAREALDAVQTAREVERATVGSSIDGDRFPAATHPTPRQKGGKSHA
jgi:hypothetical protein